jgi:hypothetical protein
MAKQQQRASRAHFTAKKKARCAPEKAARAARSPAANKPLPSASPRREKKAQKFRKRTARKGLGSSGQKSTFRIAQPGESTTIHASYGVPVIKRTRTRSSSRSKKVATAKRPGVKAPLRLPKHRATAAPAVASGTPRPPKPPDHYKFAPWADKPPTEKIRKFADEIFGDFELLAPKRKH